MIPPIGPSLEDDSRNGSPPFIIRQGNNLLECNGRVTEIDHQALFEGKLQKLFNSLVKGRPYQLAHQSMEYTIRVEPITDEIATEATDFCLYGNYLGRVQVGDEIRIRAKDRGSSRMVTSIVNLTTSSTVKPGFQLPSWLLRSLILITVLLSMAFAYMVVDFIVSGAAAALLVSLLAALMPILIIIFGIGLLFRSMFPGNKGRRRW